MFNKKIIFSLAFFMILHTANAQNIEMVPMVQNANLKDQTSLTMVDGVNFIAPNINELNQSAPKAEIVLIDKDKLEFKQNGDVEEAYLKETGALFSGSTQDTDEEGREITYFYRNGRRNGVAVSHFEDGKVELEITYRKGYKSGEEILFYENGYPKYKKNYQKNILNGEEVVFYENGKPERRSLYVNGLLDGETDYFDRNGNLIKIENYRSGKKNGVERIIENNQLIEENYYVDDKKDGTSKKYNHERLLEEISYKNDQRNGISKRYYDNGGWDEIEYVNNKIEGLVTSYYPSKVISAKTSYADNQKNGPSEKYYSVGTLQRADNYKNDVQEGISRTFDESGNLLTVSYYAGGVELAKVDLLNDAEIKKIYDAHKAGKLNNIMANKQLWYPVLWLGISLNSLKIIDELDKTMKMYAANVADLNAYQTNRNRFAEQNRRLFFGLTPLSYAVNMASPIEVLQKFATSPAAVEMENPRGSFALVEAVRLNNYDLVKYLISQKADTTKVYADGNTILLYALKEKVRDAIIAVLLQNGADVNARDTKNQTPLMLALMANNLDWVNLLLDNFADISSKTPNGKTMLSFALENNVSTEILQALLAKGANVNMTDDDGTVVALKAMSLGRFDVVQLFLQNGADVNLKNQNNENLLTYVLENQVDDELVKAIFARNTDFVGNLPKYDKPLWKILAQQKRTDLLTIALQNMGGGTKADINGEIPVMFAIENQLDRDIEDIIFSALNEKEINAHPEFIWKILDNKNPDLWQKIVAKQPDLNIVNADGEYLLHYLIKNDFPLIYLLEIEKNPQLDLQVKDKDGKDALQMAVEKNNLELAQNLVEHGMDVTKPDSNGKQLIETLGMNRDEMTEFLWQNGAQNAVSTVTVDDLLRASIVNFNLKLMQYLLDKDPNLKDKDQNGDYPQMVVAKAIASHSELSQNELLQKTEQVLNLLLQNGIDLNWQNSDGETLLIKIAKVKSKYYPMFAELLIRMGADADKKDQYNKTARDYARAYLPNI